MKFLSDYRNCKAIMEQRVKEKPAEPADAKAATDKRVKDELPDPVMEVKKHLMQRSNLYVLCLRAVNQVIAPNMPAIVQTSEAFQAATASLFIESCRWRLYERLPSTVMSFKELPRHTKD
jgi:hypothetical protein